MSQGESFGFALARMKTGERFRRSGWPKGSWVTVLRDAVASVSGEPTPVAPFLVMMTSVGRLMPFNPTQTDLLAEDWMPWR